MITAVERADELYDVIRTCTLCALSQTRTNAVPGEGPLDAEVMCIGEAPGVNEDKQGRPFVGSSGQFLSQLLAAAGLTRESVYICNVLKCRPPSNRDPLPNEIEACSEYLDLQLDLVDPLVVITLGRFSMAKWFPKQAISRIHGNVKEVDGLFVVPMYHPAAALHQGNLRQVLIDDFARIPAILERARARRVEGQGKVATEPVQPTTAELAVDLTPRIETPTPSAANGAPRDEPSPPGQQVPSPVEERLEPAKSVEQIRLFE
ncbi:MAG: uracil-DNA glycosylase [Tepidiformaceae bacterium]